MARQADTYQPSAAISDLIRRYLSGDRSKQVIDALNGESMRDARFMSFFRKLLSQANVRVGRGNSWSVGTNGSRVTGTNDNGELGGISKGVSQWNQHRNERAGYNGAPTSPGGFKSSGRDEDSALRRSGNMSADAVLKNIRFDKNDNLILGKRVYNKAQRDAILQRGMSGATMNWADQAVYDALVKSQGAQEAERERRRREAQTQADNDRTLEQWGVDTGKYRLTQEQIDALRNGRAVWRNNQFVENERLFKEADARTKAAAEAYESKMKRDREDDENRLKQREADLKWKLDSKNGGGFRYTDEQKRKFDELSRMIADAQSGADSEGGFLDTKKKDENGLTEQDRYIANLRKLQDDIKYNPMQSLVPEESLSDSIEKRTDEWGRVWSSDRDKIVYNPKDYEAENRAYEREQERRDKWLDARAAEHMKDRKEKDDLGLDVVVKGLPYDQALEQAKKDMKIRFADETPTPEETSDVFVVNPLDPVNPNNPAMTPIAQDHPVANRPTNTGNGNDWDAFFGKPQIDSFTDANGQERLVEAPVSELSQEDQASLNTCQECGAQMVNDVCPVCGYPDEEKVLAWRESQNGQEVV